MMGAVERYEAKEHVSQRLIIQSKDPVLILFEEKGESRPGLEGYVCLVICFKWIL